MRTHFFQGREKRIRLHEHDLVECLGKIRMMIRRRLDQAIAAISDPEQSLHVRHNELGLKRRPIYVPEDPDAGLHIEPFAPRNGFRLAGENEQAAFFRFSNEYHDLRQNTGERAS